MVLEISGGSFLPSPVLCLLPLFSSLFKNFLGDSILSLLLFRVNIYDSLSYYPIT